MKAAASHCSDADRPPRLRSRGRDCPPELVVVRRPCRHRGSDFLSPELLQNKLLLFEATTLLVICDISPRKPIQHGKPLIST